jgi:hypothetical protein
MAGAAMAIAWVAGAQAPAPAAPAAAPADQAPATPAAAPAAPAAPTWSVGPMDISGFIDGYYSYNQNRPSATANGQVNDLYNFNDKTNQFSLSAAKLTLNHDPDPVGAHVDFLYGRTNTLINSPTANATGEGNYLEQAFLSLKPPKAKGFELDFGKFVTSAGAEVIESKDNWNYSRSLLFVNAIPYFHFGGRASVPLSKTDTFGLQVVNGWNNVSKTNGGVTIGLVNALTKPKYTWSVNYYTGPENANTEKGYRNLIDTTLLLTPNAKFNAYLNYDYGQNHSTVTVYPEDLVAAVHTLATSGATTYTDSVHWQGGALAAHEQVSAFSALSGRFEYFADQGTPLVGTGTRQALKEFTGTYEYKWAEGLLARFEYRRDWSTQPVFHKGDSNMVYAQSTLTAGLVAFFGPKR